MQLISWDDAINGDRAELVFENRNKEYGAYLLRKKYERRIIAALLYTLGATVVLIAIPFIMRLVSDMEINKGKLVSEEVTLAEPPPIDKATPPPPPVIPPPPVQQTIKFTPPKVVKEDVVEPPPTQEEMKDVQIDTKTQEGEKIVDLPPENPVVADPNEGKIFTIVEEMPGFPGGEDKLLEYLSKNIKYPPVARENGIMGVVYVTFVVDKDGKIKDSKILRGIGGGCDEEALRVIKTMPQWKPGKQNGRAVQVQYNVPVRFSLK